VLDICRSRSIDFFTQNTVFCKYLPLRIVKDRACNGKQNGLQETERNKSKFRPFPFLSFSLSPLFSLAINRYLLEFSRASLVRKDYKSKCNMKSEISNSVHLYFTAKRSINIPFGLLISAKSFKWFNWYYLKISVISIDCYRLNIS